MWYNKVMYSKKKRTCKVCGIPINTQPPFYKHCRTCHLRLVRAYRKFYRGRYQNARKKAYEGPCTICGLREAAEARRCCLVCLTQVRNKEFLKVIKPKKKIRRCVDCGYKGPKMATVSRCVPCNSEFGICRRYKITKQELASMKTTQENKCFLCGAHSNSFKNSRHCYGLVVDHDHKTGKVRHLLCRLCNTMVGCLDKDMTLVDRMKEYIQDHTV